MTLLVVLHHSILAYAGFGHFDREHYLWSTAPVVDDRRWAGFDLVILFNDGWFMTAMFAIAGLFVLPGLRRHGVAGYLARRAKRLGVPFVVAAVVLMPLAYYPSYEMTGAAAGYWRFWVQTVTAGPWSAGPAWFLWVLLVFDAGAAALVAAWGAPAVSSRPGRVLVMAGMVAAAGSVACTVVSGPDRWFVAGPFAVQVSRIALYAASFTAGVLIGPRLRDNPLRGRPIACLVSFAALLTLDLIRPGAPVAVWRVAFAVVLTVFCFTTGLSALALARVLPRLCLRCIRRIGPDAFWIYVIHYVPMVWMQYALLTTALPGAVKGLIVFVLTLAISWAAAAALRLGSARLRSQRMPSTSIMS